jgi:hypothetical protein
MPETETSVTMHQDSISDREPIKRFEQQYSPRKVYKNAVSDENEVPCWVGKDEVVMVVPDEVTNILGIPVFLWQTAPDRYEEADRPGEIAVSHDGQQQVLDMRYVDKLSKCMGWSQEKTLKNLRHADSEYLEKEKPMAIHDQDVFALIAPVLTEDDK